MFDEENLRMYERFKSVPDEAKKPIKAGRLVGFTDVSPMWRIKTLTEAFGPCGIGWDTTILDTRVIKNETTGEIGVFFDISLCFKETPQSEWSAPIFGTGGAMLVSLEKGGKSMYTDSDAFKKAYTDALSSACKALGIAADVYWDKDANKYDYGNRTEEALALMEEIFTYGKPNDINAMAVKSKGRMVKDLTDDELAALAAYLRQKGKPQ